VRNIHPQQQCWIVVLFQIMGWRVQIIIVVVAVVVVAAVAAVVESWSCCYHHPRLCLGPLGWRNHYRLSLLDDC